MRSILRVNLSSCHCLPLCWSLQIGRSSESPIDFVVMDTIPGDKAGDSKVLQSTISRFACRILCDRSNPRIAQVYAAGFDSSRNIFLGVSVVSELYFTFTASNGRVWWNENVLSSLLWKLNNLYNFILKYGQMYSISESRYFPGQHFRYKFPSKTVRN